MRSMILPETAVRKPVFISMIFSAILLIGGVALSKLQIDMLPEIEPPVLSVITIYPGASSSDVETDVTKYIEDSLSIVNNLESLSSISKDNISVVSCKFDWGTNLDVAANDVRDALDFSRNEVKKHAPDAEEPLLFKFSSNMAPVYIATVTAEESYSQMYRIVKKLISDPFKRIPGVGAVIVDGGKRRQINIDVDHRVLQGYGLSIMALSQALEEENINLPAGEIKMGRRAYKVRVPCRFQTTEEIGDLIVSMRNNLPVHLREVAKIEDGFVEPIQKGWTDGKPCLVMMVQKQSGANTVEIVREIRQKIEALKKEVPSDIRIHPVIDTAEDIEKSINNLKGTAYLGFFMVVMVTLLALGSLRASLIIIATIPFSLILGVLFLFLKGYTVNVISLMSITIGIGMVVDNAIVVLENITSNLEKGKSREEASITGAVEVGPAVFASTLTTVVVFVPLMFATGIAGIIFGQLGFVVSVVLIASMFTSLTLTPMMCSQFFRALSSQPQKGIRFFIRRTSAFFFKTAENLYERLLDFCLVHKAWGMLGVLVIVLATVFIVPYIGTEFMPEMDSGEISIIAELPEDVRLEETERIAYQVQEIYKNIVKAEEKRSTYTIIGQSERGFDTAVGFKEGTNILNSGAKLVTVEKRTRNAKEVAHAIRSQMEHLPGIEKFEVSAVSAYQRLFFGGGGKQIVIEIMGHDLEQNSLLAEKIREVVASVPGAVDASVSQGKARKEIAIRVDRTKMNTLGVTSRLAAAEVRANLYGHEVTRLRNDGEDFKIFIRLAGPLRQDISNLEEISVPTRFGTLAKLKDFASIVEETGTMQIDRKNRERMIKVEASTWGRTLGEVTADIEKKIAAMNIPPGVEIKFGGEIKEQREAFADLTLMLALGICLVYMVMAGQFESLLQPFIIMFSIPFAFVGVVWAFFFTRTPLSLTSFIGGIMLVGIVVNNAIVLIDYINLLRDQGLGMVEAIREAGKRRLRPVFMTTITTIFGMLPMALSRIEGAEAWRPMAITIIGGLSVSTLVTLVLVPLLYSLQKEKPKNSAAA